MSEDHLGPGWSTTIAGWCGPWLAVLAGVAVALVFGSDRANALCVPAAGPGAPTAGTIVTCTGAVTNQNAPNGYGDGSQKGITINVVTGASVTGTPPGTAGIYVNDNNTINVATGASVNGSQPGTDGIFSRDGNTINNSGTILAVGALGGTGVAGGSGLTVVNAAGATIAGAVQAISARDAQVTNSGLIMGDVGILTTVGAATITNNAGATIQGGRRTIATAGDASVVNAGTLSAITLGGTAVFAGLVNPAATATVTNTGTIFGAGGNNTGVDASGTVVVNNSGTFSVDYSGSIDIHANGNASVTNSGILSARGANGNGILANGSVTLTNSGIIIADGTSGVAVGANLGNVTVTNTDGAIIIGNLAAIGAGGGGSNVFNAGTITGLSGTAIAFNGTGNVLTLAPTSIINGAVLGTGADTFQLGGASGAGTLDVGLIGPAAQYQGFGTFNKIGGATWTLTGTNTAVLPWTVSRGTLNIAPGGSLPNASFTVQGAMLSDDGTVGAVTLNGGVLTGNGTMSSLTVNAGSIVAPGHSIGQLTVTGNVGFTAGSTYQVEVNAAGQSDKILAGGAATLSGGAVQAVLLPGTYGASITYTILTAAGGRTGTFSGLSVSVPSWLIASLSYDPNDVFLTLVRNTTFFQSQAQTPNQLAVAGALDRFPTNNTLFLAAAALNGDPAIRQAYDALSGEVHASAQSVMLEDSRFLREAVLRRLRQASFAGEAGPMAALGIGGPDLAYAGADSQGFPTKAAPSLMPGPELTYWAQGIGAWGKLGGDGNAADVRRDLAGFVTGFDRRFGDWRAGIASGYTDSRASAGARASAADIATAHVAAYAGTSYGPWTIGTGAGASFARLDTSRMIAFPGFMDSATAHYNADLEQVFAELGRSFALGKIAAEPFAGLAYAHLATGSFTETSISQLAALAGSSVNADVGYSTVGARFAAIYALPGGAALTPRFSAAWQHAFGTITPTDALAFQSTGISFSAAGAPLARDAARVDAGADFHVTPQATLGIGYVGELAGRTNDHSVTGNFEIKF